MKVLLAEQSEGLISILPEFSFSFIWGRTVLLEEQHISQKNLDNRDIDFGDSRGIMLYHVMSCYCIKSASVSHTVPHQKRI
jgi:hypothetical protein